MCFCRTEIREHSIHVEISIHENETMKEREKIKEMSLCVTWIPVSPRSNISGTYSFFDGSDQSHIMKTQRCTCSCSYIQSFNGSPVFCLIHAHVVMHLHASHPQTHTQTYTNTILWPLLTVFNHFFLLIEYMHMNCFSPLSRTDIDF